MKHLKKLVLVLFVTATLLFAGLDEVFARRSGSRSRSFSRPRSSSSRSRTSSKPTSSSSKSTKPTTSKRTTTASKRTAAQQKSYEAAKKMGTAYKSKSEATAAFKKANTSKYTSKYTKKPATRPSHIPASTSVGGQNYPISYNAGMGGYGYTNSLGAWVMYDAMMDAAMVSTLMTRNNYYYDPVIARTPYRGPSFGNIILVLTLVVGVIIVAIVGVAIKNKMFT